MPVIVGKVGTDISIHAKFDPIGEHMFFEAEAVPSPASPAPWASLAAAGAKALEAAAAVALGETAIRWGSRGVKEAIQRRSRQDGAGLRGTRASLNADDAVPAAEPAPKPAEEPVQPLLQKAELLPGKTVFDVDETEDPRRGSEVILSWALTSAAWLGVSAIAAVLTTASVRASRRRTSGRIHSISLVRIGSAQGQQLHPHAAACSEERPSVPRSVLIRQSSCPAPHDVGKPAPKLPSAARYLEDSNSPSPCDSPPPRRSVRQLSEELERRVAKSTTARVPEFHRMMTPGSQPLENFERAMTPELTTDFFRMGTDMQVGLTDEQEIDRVEQQLVGV